MKKIDTLKIKMKIKKLKNKIQNFIANNKHLIKFGRNFFNKIINN